MTIKEWAKKLDGREYSSEVSKDENRQMAGDGVIAAFGASDDLLEFRGAYYEEFEAWEGTAIKLWKNREGKISAVSKRQMDALDEAGDMESIKELISPIIARMLAIEAVWCPDDKLAWLIKTGIPHETFDTMVEGALFCRGIVFHTDSIPVVV